MTQEIVCHALSASLPTLAEMCTRFQGYCKLIFSRSLCRGIPQCMNLVVQQGINLTTLVDAAGKFCS